MSLELVINWNRDFWTQQVRKGKMFPGQQRLSHHLLPLSWNWMEMLIKAKLLKSLIGYVHLAPFTIELNIYYGLLTINKILLSYCLSPKTEILTIVCMYIAQFNLLKHNFFFNFSGLTQWTLHQCMIWRIHDVLLE